MENPFAQDADCDDLGKGAEFWLKNSNSLAKKSGANIVDQEQGEAIKEDSASSYGDEDDSSEEDDAAELMREYEKLKREREEEKRLKEMAKMEEIKRR